MSEQTNSETASDDDAGTKPISVFISYAHESDEHRRRVYGLAASLRRDEFEVLIDIEKKTKEDWPLWMKRQIKSADYILCICTEEYLKRFELDGPPDGGWGVGWEGSLIRKMFYKSKSQNAGVFPFCFQVSDQQFIPEEIDCFDRFVIPIPDQNRGYESLLRKLWNRPSFAISPQYANSTATVLQTEIIAPLYSPPSGPNPDKSCESAASDGTATQKFSQAELSQAYKQTANDINRLIEKNEKLRDFLQRFCPIALVASGSARVVSDGLQTGEIKVHDILEGIHANLKTFSGTQVDWEQLRSAVGGFLVFAVDAEWVLNQRLAATDGAIQYPGGRSGRYTISFGSDQKANVLPWLTAAFSDGFASELNVSPPAVGRGVLEADKLTDLKLHFIECIFGKTDVDRGNPEDIDAYIENVRQRLKYVAGRRDPYYTSNEKYQDLETVIRKELKLQHLLLIFSNRQGVLDTLINDPPNRVALLNLAWEIFDEISRHIK